MIECENVVICFHSPLKIVFLVIILKVNPSTHSDRYFDVKNIKESISACIRKVYYKPRNEMERAAWRAESGLDRVKLFSNNSHVEIDELEIEDDTKHEKSFPLSEALLGR